jgi:hypothetical protein
VLTAAEGITTNITDKSSKIAFNLFAISENIMIVQLNSKSFFNN